MMSKRILAIATLFLMAVFGASFAAHAGEVTHLQHSDGTKGSLHTDDNGRHYGTGGFRGHWGEGRTHNDILNEAFQSGWSRASRSSGGLSDNRLWRQK